MNEENIIISKFFSSEEGMQVLDIFKKRTLYREIMPNGNSVCGILNSQLMCLREGENNFVRSILNVVNKVKIYE